MPEYKASSRMVTVMGSKSLTSVLSLFAFAAVTACGGGVGDGGGGGDNSGGGDNNGSGSAPDTENTFTAASIAAGTNPRQLTFTWTFDGRPAAFRLEGNPDGGSGYSPMDTNGDGVVDADIVGGNDDVDGAVTELNLPLALLYTDFINARFQIVALESNGNELDRSDELSILDVAGEALVGYFKATNSQQDDDFGTSVAMSWDGRFLAVGAPSEDSDADGVSSDGAGEDNNDAAGAGAVYIFTRDELGAWTRQAYIKASNSDQGDRFGASLALSVDGDLLVVGAPGEDSNHIGISTDGTGEDNNSLEGAGAVYVFARDDTGSWSQEAYIKASNPDDIDYFGHSVSLGLLPEGHIVAVGAPYEDSDFRGVSTNGEGETNDGAFVAGAVYVFKRDSAGQWSQHAYVKASNTEGGDRFGGAVALSGSADTLAVGAIQEASGATGINGDENDDSTMSAGAVYVFRMAGGSTWIQVAYVKASNTGQTDWFGSSVALSVDGDTLAVGAYSESSNATGVSTNGDGESDDSAGGAGAVYVFTREDIRTWSQQAYIKASNTREDEAFGYSVALSRPGDTLAVGAPREDSNALGVSADAPVANSGASRSGAAYVFVRDGNTWRQHAYVKASNTESGDDFGRSLALAQGGRTLVVGASEEDSISTGVNGDRDNNDAEGSGAVYIY